MESIADNGNIQQEQDTKTDEVAETGALPAEIILGGTHVRIKRGRIDTYCGYFYRGDETRMTYFTTGHGFMKDIRLIELADGRIGVFARPRHGTYSDGVRSQIGFTVIDRIEELDAKVVEEAPYLSGLLGIGEWSGVNLAYLFESGKTGVIGHSDEGRITIDNPFAGEGKIICLL